MSLTLSEQEKSALVRMYKNSEDKSQSDVGLAFGVSGPAASDYINNPMYQQMVADEEGITLEEVQRQLEEKKERNTERGKEIYSNVCRRTPYYTTPRMWTIY